MGLFDQEEEYTPRNPDDKDRLFETLEETSESSRSYLKVFSIVVIAVLVLGVIVYYLLMPGVGDQVRAPAGLEDAVRSNFQDVQKRTATDITFYKCDGYYWARVEVEARADIQTNPIYKYSRYRAKITGTESEPQILAQPVTGEEQDVPCNF